MWILLAWIVVGFAKTEIRSYDNYGQIVEDIYQMPEGETLLVFDIDETLLVVQECQVTDPDLPSFIRWLHNVKVCPAHLTEERVTNDVDDFMANGYDALALTARKKYLVEPTERELLRNGLLSWSFSAEHDFEQDLGNGKSWIFKNGVTYAGGKAKGKVLKVLLSKLPKSFSKVVFVDDNIKNIRSVNHAFKKSEDVDVLIIHYTRYH